jgi:hypothetical protein
MRFFRLAIIVTFLGSMSAFAQEATEDTLVSVIAQRWERIRIAGEKLENYSVPPIRSVINENKMRQRSARENQPRGSYDPNEATVDGRSAALERSVQDSRSVKTDDVDAFRYSASVKNNSDRKIEIIFWEYRFKEFANPANVVRHQFLCSVKIKAGDRFELFANSILAPSEIVSTASLGGGSEKVFDEKVLINRIEFADGAILQRREWKMGEVKKAIDKATSAAWGREICKPL